MKPNNPAAKSGLFPIGLIAAVLCLMFWRSFLPGYVHFSNDGPLGQQMNECGRIPAAFTGVWFDLGYVGCSGGTATLSVTSLLLIVLSPVMFAKFYPVVCLFLLGLGAWTFFRQLRLSPLAAVLGAVAVTLNSTFFSSACWGVGSQEIALSMVFFALALIVGCAETTPFLTRWARLALAGLCVGMNVIEAADIGALYSILLALFVFCYSLSESEGMVLSKALRGVVRVAVVAIFAGFIAYQSILSLVGNQIKGVVGTSQDVETKAAHWDFATQWSLPKSETLGLLVPGLFGYKMDTPKDMMELPMLPSLRAAYQNGVYWGGVGRAPELDRYFDSGSQGPQPSGPGLFMRFTGGGNYCGILVLLVAGWALAQSLRRQNSIFSSPQKRVIWFWAVVAVICLPLAWGRFAPGSKTSDGFLFYAFLYKLPYFSTIRNPAKFILFFSWALTIIFAYGVHALNRRYLDMAASKAADLSVQFTNWWSRATPFDRKWTFASVGLVGVSVVGWLVYSSEKPAMIQYLKAVGFPNDENAAAMVNFSLGQVVWFLVLLALGVGLLLVILTGYFSGPRARMGSLLLGGFLLFDLGRANLPWVIHWDYQQKYEVGSLNPILRFLCDKPYEHRVAGLPFRTPPGLELFEELYRIEWMQHQFPYYNIQSVDLVQMPRMLEDMKTYREALAPGGDAASAPRMAREWMLTSTRYLLGPAGFLDVMNQQLDPAKQRFRILQRFEVMPKPGIAQPTRLEELTAVPNENGNYALFEFTGALPRAGIYTSWQVNTNDVANLKTLADLDFDPAKTVLVSTPQTGLPAVATNQGSGSVEYQSYAPKHIVLSAQTDAPSVLLLNDKFDAQWQVKVDGKPAELLRCNFLMRGVYLPAPGKHTVDFSFSLPHKPLYVTLSAFLVGLGLGGFLWYSSRRAGGQAPTSN